MVHLFDISLLIDIGFSIELVRWRTISKKVQSFVHADYHGNAPIRMLRSFFVALTLKSEIKNLMYVEQMTIHLFDLGVVLLFVLVLRGVVMAKL